MKSRYLALVASIGLLSLVPVRVCLADANAEPPAAKAASEPVGSENEATTEAPASETKPDPTLAPVSNHEAAPSQAERQQTRREKAERKRADRAKARREKAERKKARREQAKGKHRIPLRVGAGAFAGGTLPNAAPVLGFALRAGIQRTRVSFMLEGGLSGAIGGAQSSGDRHSSRATLFYHGYLAPTAELSLTPLFVSLGVPLGVGMWSSVSNAVEPSGTVSTEVRSTLGFVSFVGGLDARLGRHFAIHGRHHLTCAIGTRVLFARQDEASTVIPLRGAIEGTSERTLGVRFVPTLTVGYDFF